MTEKEFIEIDKKKDDLHYIFFVFFAVITIIKHLLFDEKLIGGDIRYDIFILWGPIILGIATLGIYQRKNLIYVFRVNDTLINKLMYFGFVLVIATMFSFLSFHTIADFAFQIINKNEIEKTEFKIVDFEIDSYNEEKGGRTQILTGGNKIWYEYEGVKESFKVNKEIIDLLKDDSKNYLIEVELKKGIWNHFIVIGWKIKKRKHLLTPPKLH
ncbi:hypothetical protein [Tenacibaculum sp. nBUS_03]|uniref:hypothetical protein n=1 Tax=Tenacibaculum sp. nBUS_03 TaxID=3395320 RepID=UPI003EBE23AE